ncbi:MAG TPA: PAS domain S-box protein [Steroidobacteraceae bacterium]|nr:PAS domain S-box protein [Steroidobacteraceae bacterium]
MADVERDILGADRKDPEPAAADPKPALPGGAPLPAGDIARASPFSDAEALRGHLAAIVASSDDAIISKTLNGVILSWNKGAERMFGYTSEEAVGKPITILIPAEQLDEEPVILAKVRRGERIDHYETVRVRKDGGRLYVSLTVSPVRDGSGRIVGASKIARDITHQKSAESQVRASEQRFRLMADSAPVLIWMSDASRARTWCNKAWLDFTGGTLEHELGFGWSEHVHPDDLAGYLRTYVESFDVCKPFRTEFRLRRHDGETRWMIDTAVPLREGPVGTFSGYIGSCIDITEYRQSQLDREDLLRAERAARTEAERLSRVKDEFLATLSHELRTPLNAILGWSTLLRRVGRESPDFARGLETIERNARAQSQIIGDLLDMSRIISGKVQLDIQTVDPHEVIEAALESVRPSAEAKGLRVRMRVQGRVELIRADPSRLQQVLWNLLTNAVKFTPPRGLIDVTVKRVNGHVEIVVEDTGIGVKPEFLDLIFDRFRQADASTTRRHGGLGLGLSIVKQLVELHGGSVSVKSPGLDQGTTFTVMLPMSATRADDDTVRQPRPTFADVDFAAVDLPSLSGVKVLVVDDEPDSRVLVSRLVEDRGALAIPAASAEEALHRIVKEPVDIVVSDIGMPEVDGYQLMRQIRGLERETLRGVMAIALTAYARPADRQRALLAGYQMHLCKPVDPRELVVGIASLLNIPKQMAH